MPDLPFQSNKKRKSFWRKETPLNNIRMVILPNSLKIRKKTKKKNKKVQKP